MSIEQESHFEIADNEASHSLYLPENKTYSPNETIILTRNTSGGHDFNSFYIVDHPDGDLQQAQISVVFTDTQTQNPFDRYECYGVVSFHPASDQIQTVDSGRKFSPESSVNSYRMVWDQKIDSNKNPLGFSSLQKSIDGKNLMYWRHTEGEFETFRFQEFDSSLIKTITIPRNIPYEDIVKAALTANQIYYPAELNIRTWQNVPNILPVSLSYNPENYTLYELDDIPYGKDGQLHSEWSSTKEIPSDEVMFSNSDQSTVTPIFANDTEDIVISSTYSRKT